MYWQFYVRRRTIFIPTSAQTEAGFYLNVDPVAVLNITDTDGVRMALADMLARGNPRVPTPNRATFPPPIVLKYAKLKRWSEFEEDADSWTLTKDHRTYQLGPSKRRSDRGWEEDPIRLEVFSGNYSLEAISGLVTSRIQNYYSKAAES
jgi:hypothetical protein